MVKSIYRFSSPSLLTVGTGPASYSVGTGGCFYRGTAAEA